MNKKIYPCLWFNGNAKEAAEFYNSVFDCSVIKGENQFVVNFESSGQRFMCLNGGPEFAVNPSISFYMLCESEEEINRTWNTLLEKGSVLMALDKYPWSPKYGWVKDKYGVTWQLTLGKYEDVGQKFTPFLMFTGKQNGKTEEAIGFYTSVFGGPGLTGITRYTNENNENNEIEGNVAHAQFVLGSNVFMAMDSSFDHKFSFNEAISLVVECDTQDEIDYYWNKLTKGGEESQCGWLKDKYGVSWQIVPAILEKLMNDPSKSERVVNAFLQMKKFEIEKLVNA